MFKWTHYHRPARFDWAVGGLPYDRVRWRSVLAKTPTTAKQLPIMGINGSYVMWTSPLGDKNINKRNRADCP